MGENAENTPSLHWTPLLCLLGSSPTHKAVDNVMYYYYTTSGLLRGHIVAEPSLSY